MPKILVLFHGQAGNTARLADAIAEGVRGVRFAEVDVRRIDSQAPAGSHQALRSADDLEPYDAIILGASAPQLTTLLEGAEPLRRRGAFRNRVGAAFSPASATGEEPGSASWATLRSLARLGMILVPPDDVDPDGPVGDDAELEAARRLGRRVAEVTGWVTHARSHHHHH